MPVTHLLDTSVYSQPIRKVPHPEVMKRWQALNSNDFHFIPGVTIEDWSQPLLP